VILPTRCLFTLSLILAIACQSLGFQNPNQTNEQEQTLKLKAELVEIRAVVTDKSGRIIDNLTRDDFELFENDAPQQVVFFSRERIGEKPVTTEADKTNPLATLSQAKPKSTRTIILFVDTLHLSPGSVHLVRQALRRFVNQQMTDDDLVCLVTSNGSLGLAEQFTQNRQLLRYGIERIRPQGNLHNSRFTPYVASMALRGDRASWNVALQIMLAEGLAFPGLNCADPNGPDQCGIRAHSNSVLNEAMIRRKSTLATLKYVTDRLAKMPGQRIINLFSEGFSLMQEGGGVDTIDIQSVTSRASRAGVIIYSMDAKGLDTTLLQGDASSVAIPFSPDFASAMSMSKGDLHNGLNALASDTGGRFLLNTNDLGNSVAKVLEENRTYYALAYYPDTEKERNKFRRISARVKGHPEYNVRTQRGYLPAELFKAEKEDKGGTPQQQLFKAIVAPLPTTDLGVAVSADYLENDSDSSQVWAQIHVEGNDLTYRQEKEGFRLTVEIATQIFNSLGKPVSSTIDTVEGKLQPHRVPIAKQNGFRQVKRIALKPGVYQIRVGVREPASEKIGTATALIEVPDLQKKKLAMSSLFLSESAGNRDPGNKAAEPVNGKAKTQGNQGEEFFLAKVVQGIPVYKSGHFLAYYFVIYNKAAKASEPADLLMQIQLIQEEKAVYISEWQPVSDRLIKQGKKGLELGGMLQLGLPPGIYEMRILVKEAKSKKPIQQTAIIGVEP
jgi:VWFA-related protein